MKIPLIFIFASLCVGILDNAFAVEIVDPSPAESVVQAFVSLLRVCRLENRFESIKVEENNIREKCTRNGGPNAYDNAKRAREDIRNALNPLINETLTNPALNNYQSWNAEESISTICRIVRPLRNLTTTALASIGSCLDEGERHTANAAFNSHLSMIDFACEDNGKHFLTLWRANGFQCFARDGFFRNCSRNSFDAERPGVNYTIFNPVYRVGSPWYFEAFVPSLRDCQQQQSFQNCTVEVTKKCESTELPELVNSLFKTIEKASGCDNLLKAQRTLAAEEKDNSNRSD